MIVQSYLDKRTMLPAITYQEADLSTTSDDPVVISIGKVVDGGSQEECTSLTSFMQQACQEMCALYETTEKCNAMLSGRIVTLNAQNGHLSLQLEASNGRQRDVKILHGAETQVLKERVTFLKEQMACLRAEQQKEEERLNKLLEIAKKEKEDALAAAEAAWQQQKTELDQQKTAVQAQLSDLNGEVHSLQTQATQLTSAISSVNTTTTGLTATISHLNSYLSGATGRLNARIVRINTLSNNFFDMQIKSFPICMRFSTCEADKKQAEARYAYSIVKRNVPSFFS